MDKKKVKLSFLIAGAVAIISAFIIFIADKGYYVDYISYGGDAYTGIQNAAARTGSNVNDLAAIVSKGFSAVLLVIGILLVGIGTSIKEENLFEKNNVKDTLDEKTFTFNKPNAVEENEEVKNEEPCNDDTANN